MDINTGPSCDWTMGPNMVLGSSSDLDVTMVPVGSAGHLNHHGPNNGVVLEPLHGLRCGFRSQASALPLMATGILGICAGPVCSSVRDPDMALATAQVPMMPWPQVTVHITQVCMALGHRDGNSWRPRSWDSVWPLEATPASKDSTSTHQHRFRLW